MLNNLLFNHRNQMLNSGPETKLVEQNLTKCIYALVLLIHQD